MVRQARLQILATIKSSYPEGRLESIKELYEKNLSS